MLPPKSSFSEWFSELLSRAQIIDTRYRIKGMYVWLPFGLKLRNLILDSIRRLLDESGHQEMLFPSLIPQDQLAKESQHVKGFEDSVFWVTHGGLKKLSIPLALRPTSETAIYPMLSLWIRSHAQLPLKLYQIVSVFRYETKHTRPLIRVREITCFKEAHTAHPSSKEAEAQVKQAIHIYSKFFDDLGIPYLIVKRPEWDKFPGADYSVAFDTLMPDGRCLQIATIHNLGTNFSKAFQIRYEDLDGSWKYVYQTCYGISERVIAATIGIHGDDRGLILPPSVAPVQAVVIPIPYRGYSSQVMDYANEIHSELIGAGIRSQLDSSELTPGEKYYLWELRGACLRLELGPRDLRNNQITLVRRDSLERIVVPRHQLIPKINELLGAIQHDLRQRALAEFSSRIKICDSLEQLAKVMGNGIAKIGWCGDEECGKQIQRDANANFLGEDLNPIRETRKCLCGAQASKWAYLAKSY